MSDDLHASVSDMRVRLDTVMIRDRARLDRRLAAVERLKDPARRERDMLQIASQIDKSHARVKARQEAVPTISYPDLPVSARRGDIANAIRDSQVVVIAGETGSGKTTQLPKILLELGKGIKGQIGHTQPRRIAARAVAERIAEELDVEFGDVVGYQVRFADHANERTLIKVMTDGILLAEITKDRLLTRYDAIVIDEAHERSLTIDFLLGYLREILPRRPDLKLIVTSATIDTSRFAAHFHNAPVIEVSGRTYPVELRYQPYGITDDRDQIQAITEAVEQLQHEGPGDVLVFLSGEREIKDTAESLRSRGLRGTEILPLYSRLSAAEQHRVFEPHTGRRVVLATNVAETSLTVPGIRYVVDPGTARVSRYSARLKVQRLPIEAISQASANQRAGRCGRVADGICIRLYDEDDFAARPEFTEPEILRTNLASVILAMTALDLGDVEAFGFVDPPDARQIRDGVEVLRELGALHQDTSLLLTATGRSMAGLPLDPRLARMVVQAHTERCLAELLVIASALSIQDPRERPAEHQSAADLLHRRFADPNSDVSAYLNLWRYLKEQQDARSGNSFRRMCRDEFLHYLRIREWQDVHSQLRQACKDLGFEATASPGSPDAVHRSMLAGMLSHIGSHDPVKRDYQGARGARWTIHPGSGLARKPPQFAVAAELVETTRLFGRVVARIDPLWAEELAGDIATRTYSEPRWSKKRAAVMATERVTLYGVPLVVGRAVQYGSIDPVASRDLFIRHALVQGEWDAPHRFLSHNRALVAQVTELEDKARRRGLLVEDQVLTDWYDERIPPVCVSGRHFDRWWKTTRRTAPDLLNFPRELVFPSDDLVEESQFPRSWSFGELGMPELPLAYAFEPGETHDGVTVDVPVTVLAQLDPMEFLRQVPGRRKDVVVALIRSLPKNLRTRFVPVPDTARKVLPELVDSEPLMPTLADALTRLGGFPVTAGDFSPSALPDHLRVTFRVVNEQGVEIASGKDLAELRSVLAPEVQATLSAASKAIERQGLTSFPMGGLARSVSELVGEHTVTGYPALVDRGGSVGSGGGVDLVVLPSATLQQRAMRKGTARLIGATLSSPLKSVVSGLTTAQKLGLGHTPYVSVTLMLADVVDASIEALIDANGGPAWSPAEFTQLSVAVREGLHDEADRAVRSLASILTDAWTIRSQLEEFTNATLNPLVTDVRTQIDALLSNGFVAEAGVARLPDIQRYLKAVEQRIVKAPQNVARDQVKAAEISHVATAVVQAIREHGETSATTSLRWSVEELRVSLFGQGLKTATPVSSTRILRAIAALDA